MVQSLTRTAGLITFQQKNGGHSHAMRTPPQIFLNAIPTVNLRSRADSRRLGRRDTLVLAIGLLLRRLAALADVDATLEERTVFDRDACRDHVTGERSITADINAVAGRQIAAHFAQHDNFTGVDVGCNNTVASNSNAVSRQADRAFDPAINVERLRSSYLALDHQRFADSRLVCGSSSRGCRRTWRSRRFIRHHGRRARCIHGWTLRLGRATGGLRLIRRLPHGLHSSFPGWD